MGIRYILSAFDFDIVFTISDKNATDFLSRMKVGKIMNTPLEPECLSFIFDDCPFIINWAKIKTQSRVDTTLSLAIRAISTGEWPLNTSTNLL